MKAKLYKGIAEFIVLYVNRGWKQDYKVEDIVGIELTRKTLWAHFNEKEYTKEAYPIDLSVICSDVVEPIEE